MHSIKIGGMSGGGINSVCQMESQAGNRNANQDMAAPWWNSGYLAGGHPWKLMTAGMGGRAWSLLLGGTRKSFPPQGCT